MSGLGEQLESIIHEGIESYLGEHDFKDDVESVLGEHDFKDEWESALGEHDFSSAIRDEMSDFDFSDAIHDSVKNYDWWEEIEDKVKDEIETEMERGWDELQGKIDRRFDSPEFKALVKGIVVEITKDVLRSVWERMTHPFRKAWSWLRKWV